MTEFNSGYMERFFSMPAPKEESDTGMREIELENLLAFHTGDGHPFEVEMDQDMQELMEDVKENGVLEPIIVRRDSTFSGRYEMITGHRRVYVLRELGIPTVKSLLVDYDDQAAIKLMVASNLKKRTHIKPSVKAKAYKMYMDANKKQAGRPKNNSSQLETKLRTDENVGQVGPNLRTAEKAAEEFGESASKIKRYIRLNELTPELLSMVDKDELKFGTAVELSYLSESAQEAVTSCLKAKVNLSLEQAKELKEYEKDGGVIDLGYLKRWLGAVEEAPKEKKQPKPKLNERFINEYLPLEIRKKSVEEKRAYIQAALIFYNNYLLDHPEAQKEWEESDE